MKKCYYNLKAWADDKNIKYAFIPLETNLWGFVYRSSRGNYHIIIDKNLTRELQERIFCHEVEHIKSDMPDKSWFIGMNMQYDYFERRANQQANDLVAEMAAIFL